MSTTWTEDTTQLASGMPDAKGRVSKAVCTTGTEADSQLTAGSDHGLLLAGLARYSVFIESSATAFTAGTDNLLAYRQNPASGKWCRRRDMDLSVAAVVNDSFGDYELDGDEGRLAFLPSGLGQGSTIWIVGHSGR